LTYDPRALTYDAENRMISATSSQNGNESYLYDGDGRRVRKTWNPNGGTTQITTYVYGPSGLLAAEYTNQIAATTGTSWMFTDLLGSVRAVTGEKPQSGTAPMTECYDYLPFGRMLSSSDNGRNTGCYPANPDFALSSVESPKFTGKVRDGETGLDFFGARYLSSAQGRWMIPDWSAKPVPIPYADLSDPQSLNLYEYVHNNPLNKADRDGHCDGPCWGFRFLSYIGVHAGSVGIGIDAARQEYITAAKSGISAAGRDALREEIDSRTPALGRALAKQARTDPGRVAARAAKTEAQLAESVPRTNAGVTGSAEAAGVAGKAAIGVAVGISVYNVATAPKGERARTAAGEVGGLGGALAVGGEGAEAGAVIGSFFGPGPGTAIGAGVGGLVGSILGGWGGSTAGTAVYDGVTKPENQEQPKR
jgi:RHS repeat-associated protein